MGSRPFAALAFEAAALPQIAREEVQPCLSQLRRGGDFWIVSLDDPQHLRNGRDLDFQTDDSTAHHKLLYSRSVADHRADNPIARELVFDVENERPHAFAQVRDKFLLAPASAGRVELIALVYKLQCPRKIRMFHIAEFSNLDFDVQGRQEL